MKYILFFVPLLSLYSCGERNASEQDVKEKITPELLIAEVQIMEDSINNLFEQFLTGEIEEIDRLVYHEAINRNLAFYKTFPAHEFAAKSVDNAAGMYMALQIEPKARDWRDTLIFRYPDFKGRKMAIELQISYYDIDDYQPELLEKYIHLLLAEKGLTEDKKEQLMFRLQHIDLDYKELLLLQNPDLAQ